MAMDQKEANHQMLLEKTEHVCYLKTKWCGPCPNCYHRGCRCDDCTRANTEKKRLYNRPDSGWDNRLVPIKEVQEHLAELREQGIGLRRVADMSGVSFSCIWKINIGRYKRIRNDNAKKILAVTFDREWTRPNFAAQKLSDLALVGVPTSDIIKATGLDERTLCNIKMQRTSKIKRKNHDMIMALQPKDFKRRSKVTITREKKRLGLK